MEVIRWMSGHGDATRFRWVFELPMASHSSDEKPTIISEELEDITNLHSADMIGESIENQKP
jgi:hypothetical protein